MALIDKVVTCKELLETMEREAEEILLKGASMVVTSERSKL